MIRHEEEGVVWLEFEQLAGIKEISHGIFLRHGGVSLNSYSSLNFSFQVGDDPNHVSSNTTKGMNLLGIKKAIRGRLNHGNEVAVADDPNLTSLTSFDALITNMPEIGLLITHADCQATLLYDPIAHAAANIHCGWRGNINNIYQKTVAAMQEKYGSNPKNILACISPSLGPENGEFIHFKEEWPEFFWKYQVKPTYFDLWTLSEDQLIQCGLLRHHIETARLCTYALPQDYFSYRREKQTGRHATIISLKKKLF